MEREVYPRPGGRCRHTFVRQLALFVLLVAAWPSPSLRAADEAAKLYEEGRKAERAGHIVQAYLLFSQASALEPDNQFYWIKAQAMQARAALESPPKPPASETAKNEAPPAASSPFDGLTAKDLAAERDLRPPVELQPASGQRDFDLTGDAKSLWEKVAQTFALDTVFDGDYPSGPKLRFQLTNVDYRGALHGLEAATGSFAIPVSKRLILVVKDSEQKRKDVEPVEAAVIPVPQAATTQELTEIAQAVRQLFSLEHVAFDTAAKKVVLRGRDSLIEPARLLFEEMLRNRAQVSVEVQLIEVDFSSSLAYGLDLTPTIPLTYLNSILNSPILIPSGATGILSFGGGMTLFGIGIASTSMMAQLTTGDTRTLFKSVLHAVDGTATSMHVGTRLPVLTSGYFGPASFSQGGTVYTPPPSFTFEDLGVGLKVTPHVNGIEEVTLELETEFKQVTGQSLNGIPIISSRKYTSSVRLREGDSAVVAGLLTSDEARSISGVAGLAQIPGLGGLFRLTNKSLQTSEVILVIKPSLLNLPPDELPTPAIFTGSATRPLTPL